MKHLLFCVKIDVKEHKKTPFCYKLLEFVYMFKKISERGRERFKKKIICVIIISYTEYSRSNRSANVKNTHKGGWIIS